MIDGAYEASQKNALFDHGWVRFSDGYNIALELPRDIIIGVREMSTGSGVKACEILLSFGRSETAYCSAETARNTIFEYDDRKKAL